MRFRPIGFGDVEVGKKGFGSSSLGEGNTEYGSNGVMEDSPAAFRRPASIDSDADHSVANGFSYSDASSSDKEMIDAPALPFEGAAPVEESANKDLSKEAARNNSSKRKHGGGERNSKKSSSKPATNIDDRQLKHRKKNRSKPQRSMADRASASIELHRTIPTTKPTKNPIISSSSSALNTPKAERLSGAILPPPSSAPTSSQNPIGSNDLETVHSSKNSKFKNIKKHKSSFRGEDAASLQDLTRATDPRLTGEERQQKITKLKKLKKHKDRSQHRPVGSEI